MSSKQSKRYPKYDLSVPSTELMHEKLLSDAEFEIAGSDRLSGHGYRVTVRRVTIDGAVFSHIDSASLEQSVRDGLPLCIGLTEFRVAPSLAAMFLRAACESTRIPATSVTIQTAGQVICFYGKDSRSLASPLASLIPSSVEWSSDSLVEETRELGRKVGHAAKDLAGIRDGCFDVSRLEMLERSGESEAYEAVCKRSVWPAPDLGTLRSRGVPPSVAYTIVECWRMLRHRPAGNRLARLVFVRDLPRLREAMEACQSLKELSRVLSKGLARLEIGVKPVAGNRLPSFSTKLHFAVSREKPVFLGDRVVCEALTIEQCHDPEACWALAAGALSGPKKPASDSKMRGKRSEKPLPRRERLLLADLQRSGEGMLEPPEFDRIPEVLGLTGLEFGNYVSAHHGEKLSKHLGEAFCDLQSVLGDWIVPVCRRGNLSIALGARGHGTGCAHYEPGLRVINLTKLRGDGSIAHEFAHFLDQMLAAEMPEGDARYLSARVHQSDPNDSPIAEAMHRLFQLFDSFPHHERLVGDVEGKRTYGKIWLTRRGYSPDLDPQTAFDVVADAQPTWFRRGCSAKYGSGRLADSLAKYAQASVEVEAAYECESDYLLEARRLGRYWKCPQELFARAFESYVEDELNRRDWVSQYLVNGTQACYSNCRGLPYPQGTEREQFGIAVRKLIDECGDRFG